MRLFTNLAAVYCVASSLGLVAASQLDEVRAESQPVRQVAIIGAGAAGSSTAYYLRQFAEEANIAVNITVFERTDRIGGRSLTVLPFGNASQPVELGASIFIKNNHILYAALQEFDLQPNTISSRLSDLMGIWDGEKFVFTINTSDSSWWIGLKVTLKYGISGPRKAMSLMTNTMSKFLNLYKTPFFPFRSLTQRAYELDLAELTSLTGAQFLTKNKIPDQYAHDIIQASTRVNYASNLDTLHALDTMVSQASEGAMSVHGGNWQLFQEMVSRAGAKLYLNSSVTSITKNPESQPKYLIKAAASADAAKGAGSFAFDDVVIAAPYQFSKIDAGSVIQHAIDDTPYITLHVTVFSSPWELNRDFFNLTDKELLPGFILTTLADDDTPASGVQGAGKAGFYSVNILRKVVNSKNNKEEYLYKIFSPEKLSADFLSRLLGVKVPETIISIASSDDHSGGVEPISWYHPHVFHSYPKALPRVTFQDPIIGDGLYYTSGMENFISTMESNALMGKNVARLIVDDIVGIASGGAVLTESAEVPVQHVMDL